MKGWERELIQTFQGQKNDNRGPGKYETKALFKGICRIDDILSSQLKQICQNKTKYFALWLYDSKVISLNIATEEHLKTVHIALKKA